MKSFILGYPKEKPQIKENIQEYTDLQSCASATNSKFVNIVAENIEKAKERFMEIAANNFEPQIKKA